MCGRYTLHVPTRALMDLFDLPEVPDLLPRYNVAPSQEVPVVRQRGEARELTLLRWGLIPFWSKDPKRGPTPINARSDSAAEKPAFRTAFRRHRCLLPADGFYEWKKEGTKKQPVLFRMRDEGPFAFAGLWDRWEGPDGQIIQSCTLLTTEPNALVETVHDRMPVILPPEAYDLWLDPTVHEPARVQPLLRPYPAEAMTATPVSPRVNSPREDSPDLITPMAAPTQLKLF
jgi:putative SOS response-associated peptidase YedK